MGEKLPFEKLHHVDLGKSLKSNQEKRYLAWNDAWAELKKLYPDATYEFHCDEGGIPYFYSAVGLFVKVSVTVKGITHTMTRPVYNKAFKSMKLEPYEYTTKSGKKSVAGANADDVNDALMRCFVKAISMHGLGLYVYQDNPYAEAELLSASQITEISNLIAKHKLMLGELNKVFGINKLSELHEINFESALQWIEDNKTR